MAMRSVWLSAFSYCGGTLEGLVLAHEGMDYAAQNPARTFLCQRFTPGLAGSNA